MFERNVEADATGGATQARREEEIGAAPAELAADVVGGGELEGTEIEIREATWRKHVPQQDRHRVGASEHTPSEGIVDVSGIPTCLHDLVALRIRFREVGRMISVGWRGHGSNVVRPLAGSWPTGGPPWPEGDEFEG
ncbi:hypothetical protein OEB96_46160 [Paraliomyxa miuraensis]|nr:hypothetical protein [Paraliomyxa miuraensis]MCX4248084.1 hypothetical protein [Paraliomyxa miuraensis]